MCQSISNNVLRVMSLRVLQEVTSTQSLHPIPLVEPLFLAAHAVETPRRQLAGSKPFKVDPGPGIPGAVGPGLGRPGEDCEVGGRP